MPNTREKLIELLNNSFDEQYGKRGLLTAQHTADYLIAHGAAVQRWIPLSEQKPGRDELILVFFDGMRDTECAIQVQYGWCIGGSASHWMPLPEPPKEDNVDRCVCCGEIIPEGRMVCPNCLVTVKREDERSSGNGKT